MYSPVSNLALAVAIHGLKNKTLLNKLETFWINEELATHGRYSPFMLEAQQAQDLKANFWSLSTFVLFVLIDGLMLCACSHWLIQCIGIALCLLATFMIRNIGTAIWQSLKIDAQQTKETVWELL